MSRDLRKLSAQDQRFMKMAIEESKKSQDEHDGRSHPKVGAVIVRNGKLLASAHRGEVELGDHAEYTAFERKLPSVDLTGATLYTTLEPCTSRKNKTPCADRVIHRKISRVVIGAIDPNPSIYGGSVGKLMMEGVDVSFIRSINPNLEKEIKTLNSAFFEEQSDAARPESNVVLMQRLCRLSQEILNPIALFPLIFTISLTFCSMYFYRFTTQSLISFWSGVSEAIMLLLGIVLIPLGIVYIATKVWLSRSTEMPGISLQSVSSSLWKRIAVNRLFLKGVLLLLLLAVFITMTDAKFGVVSPRVDHVVTQFAPGYFLTGSISNYRVLVRVTKTYFINSPLLWLIGTIEIPNPSNYSYSQQYGCYNANYGSGPPVFCGEIIASASDSRARLSPQINASGSIRSFEVILSPVTQSYTTAVAMSYDDYIYSAPIIAAYGTPVQAGSVSYRVINITLSNPFSVDLLIGQLQIGHYDDILNISCVRTGAVYGVGCTNNSTTALWLWQQNLSPGQTINFALNVTYSGATYA